MTIPTNIKISLNIEIFSFLAARTRKLSRQRKSNSAKKPVHHKLIFLLPCYTQAYIQKKSTSDFIDERSNVPLESIKNINEYKLSRKTYATEM